MEYLDIEFNKLGFNYENITLTNVCNYIYCKNVYFIFNFIRTMMNIIYLDLFLFCYIGTLCYKNLSISYYFITIITKIKILVQKNKFTEFLNLRYLFKTL